ncbi:MAG: ferrous iron transport protein A [Pirellulaceae bacterium]|nr:ferrous iron transport protein A [Pirellulaceae bacterium]
MPLDQTPPGRRATIVRLSGCPEHVRRLQEMGLRRGTTVHVVRSGRPCIVRVSGNRLCIRCSELLGVWVQPQGAAD